MNGLVYVLDKLGRALAETEQALVASEQAREVLQARVAELEAAAEKSPIAGPE